MKDLQKLALILRALGMSAKVISEPISMLDGSQIDNTFVSASRGKCCWNIWHEGKLFEVHLYFADECVYDTVCHSLLFSVVSQITSDYYKFDVQGKSFTLA